MLELLSTDKAAQELTEELISSLTGRWSDVLSILSLFKYFTGNNTIK